MDQNFSYVSCIKINGVPILPPLVTSDRKQELLEYKRQALLLEKLYSNKKSNSKKFNNESKSVHGELLELESDISVFSNTQSCNSNNQNGNSLIYVPFKNENKKKFNLSSSIIDVSEYSSDTKGDSGNQVITELKLIKTDAFHPSLHKDNYNSDALNLISGSTEIVLKEDTSDLGDEKKIGEKPRLIRSNSYTLDNPSPLLLAHLRRQSSVSSSSDQGLTDSSHEESESILLGSRSEEKDSSDINILENSSDWKYSNVSEINISSDVNKKNSSDQNDPLDQPTIEIITTDITVQEINITTPIKNDNKIEHMDVLNSNMRRNSNEISRTLSVDDVQITNTDTELKSILKQIPEMYSSKILEIIDRQKIEQQQKLDDYKISTKDSVDYRNAQNTKSIIDQADKKIYNCQLNRFKSGQNILPNTLSENIEIIRKARSVSDCTTLNVSDTLKQGSHSVAESQSLYYDISTSCSEPMEDFSSRTIKSINNPSQYTSDNKAIYDNMYLDTFQLSNSTQNSFNRNVPVPDNKAMRRGRENKAASVIGAYAKGYLVRRMMRTARVQTLIQTIHDALLCALELQGLEVVEEADVELHRRLIQQVSAACYEFHDIFFGLTIPEKMDLIAIDREKKRKILPVRTSRSSIDFLPKGHSSSNTRLTKSLTKI